jgi:hypothetical protein
MGVRQMEDAHPCYLPGARFANREAPVYDLHARIPEPLIADARKQAPQLGVAALVRLALARLAGWPESAAQTAARPRGERGAS